MTGAVRVFALVVLASACGKPAAPRSLAAPTRLVLVDSVDQLDALAREPMVVRHQSGALFVTGYWDTIPPVGLRVSYRGGSYAGSRTSYNGFRLAQDIP